MFLGAMLLGTALGATQLLLVSGANRTLGLSDELFVLGDSVMLTVLGQVSFMPILVLAARLCPEGVEATLFATLMSILNGGSFVGSALGAALTSTLGVTSSDFSNLFMLVLLCVVSTLLPAPFLGLLPSSLDQDPPESGSSSSGTSSNSNAAAGGAAYGVSSLGKSNSKVELAIWDDNADPGRTDGLGQHLQQQHGFEQQQQRQVVAPETPAADIEAAAGLPLLWGHGGWSSVGSGNGGTSSDGLQEKSGKGRKVKGR
eukprot:GHUV01025924.1.p1 GENE.GHUV01025924.1~~GHUV01025924.1.p1  ORF type:complete len:258 (+),score=69.31 GHUV01025924.1:190-963(+)